MTTATNRFKTSSPFYAVDIDVFIPAGVTIISLDKPMSHDSLVEVIYAHEGQPEHHKTCKVSKVTYDALRHEQNRQ